MHPDLRRISLGHGRLELATRLAVAQLWILPTAPSPNRSTLKVDLEQTFDGYSSVYISKNAEGEPNEEPDLTPSCSRCEYLGWSRSSAQKARGRDGKALVINSNIPIV